MEEARTPYQDHPNADRIQSLVDEAEAHADSFFARHPLSDVDPVRSREMTKQLAHELGLDDLTPEERTVLRIKFAAELEALETGEL